MQNFEYRVMPAPKRGKKGKGVKGTEAQFANALTLAMNEAAADGWEYIRTDTLPCEERQGLTGRVTVFQNMLVFRRPLDVAEPQTDVAATDPPIAALPAPQPEEPVEMAAEDDGGRMPTPNPQIAGTLGQGHVAAE